jgi:hypothetical protein
MTEAETKEWNQLLDKFFDLRLMNLLSESKCQSYKTFDDHNLQMGLIS